MSVNENIKKYRIKQGLTQKQLGELCNIAESTIRRYELGKLNPKYETIQKIAHALNIHELVLLEQISEEFSSDILSNDVSCSAAYTTLLKSIYGKIDLRQIKENGYIQYEYILGDKKEEVVISDLTYDNMYEALIFVIEAYVNASKNDYNSQDIYSLAYSLKEMDLKQIKELKDYALFLISQKSN